MSTKANLIEHVAVGEYGYPLYLQVIDANSDPIDISLYSAYYVILRSPDSLKTITYTATLVGGGTDGRLSFIFANGDIDRPGVWNGIIKMTAESALVKSELFEMVVLSAL